MPVVLTGQRNFTSATSLFSYWPVKLSKINTIITLKNKPNNQSEPFHIFPLKKNKMKKDACPLETKWCGMVCEKERFTLETSKDRAPEHFTDVCMAAWSIKKSDKISGNCGIIFSLKTNLKLGNITGLVSILHHIILLMYEQSCQRAIVFTSSWTLQQTTHPFICHLKRTSHVVLKLIYFLWKTWCLQNENITFYHPELVMRVFHLKNAKLGHITDKNGSFGLQPRRITFSFDLHNSSHPTQPHSIIAKQSISKQLLRQIETHQRHLESS